MAIIQLHTPKGIFPIDSDIVTDEELAAFEVTREAFSELIPGDLAAEIDELKVRLDEIEIIRKT